MAMIQPLVVLALICGVGVSATPTLAPAPAPTALLTEDKLCVGISLKNHRLTCVVNTAVVCFASNSVTGEASFQACFVAGIMTANCLAKAKDDNKYHCVGLEISDDLVPCFGEVAWNCYDSFMVYTAPTFAFCFYAKVATCFL